MKELIRYYRLLVNPRRILQRKVRGDSEVIISLSSTPDRIGKIAPALASLLDQRIIPEKIILYLPLESRSGKKYDLPDFLLSHPLINVKRVAKDLGPATKWFYTGEDASIAPDQPIIVLDDDQVYPKKLVEHYLNCRKKFPNSAFTLLGWNVPPSLLHKDRIPVAGARVRVFGKQSVAAKPERVDCVQGASSFMVTKKMLQYDETYFDHKAAHFADDILVSGLLAKNNIPVMVAPGPFRYVRLHSMNMMKASSLFDINKSAGYNEQLYEVFRGYWKAKNQTWPL